ncbi:hypothetical protein [Comamonas terrigena]|uniref:hypothetical protein n=1 Tax=Comamonas terrigena TaxID=32013 RepID=UPI0028B1486F|nr:hypothetical protein [Comamonas terrigena]
MSEKSVNPDNEHTPHKGKPAVEASQHGTNKMVEPLIAPQVAQGLEATQIGKFATKGGTGFAAEDANAFIDERLGRTVERTGLDNAKNGADRIVDGVAMQTKYFDSASRTVNSAFDSKTGLYRYDTMQLEVPKDQYNDAVKLMEKRISEGKVPGVTNPADAPKMIRRGNVTYRQARNIARAGNVDSLKYDARNGMVICTAAFGFSFAVEFAAAMWRGESSVGALKNAVLKGLQTAGLAFFTSVGSAQLLRTQTARIGTVVARQGVKQVAKTKLGRTAIEKIAEASLGKAVSGAAAVNHVSKLLRSNVITGAVTVTVMTLPDLYKASISGSISWAQVGKNLVVNASSIVGGTAGWTGGVAVGASIGSVIPGLGTAAGGLVGGLVGSIGGGVAAHAGAKTAMDKCVVDDAVKMQELLQKELMLIADEYVLTQPEFDAFLSFVADTIPGGYLKDLYASSDRPKHVRSSFEDYAFEFTKRRKSVTVVPDLEVMDFIDDLLERVEAGESLEPHQPYVPNFVLGPAPGVPATLTATLADKSVLGVMGSVMAKFS